MNAHRLSGAPRLIEWTGERCVPWAPDVQVVYEHLHRYLWASQLAPGRRVLDLASGEGFGAAMLAETAARAVGIDIDEPSIDHARLNYAAPNLEYRVADAHDLSDFADDSFEMVVAFEMIEHVADQAQVIGEIRRVLTPDGVVIISTPERGAYSEATGQQNPFHVQELTRAEFIALLGCDFAHVAAWGQRTITGSAISALGPAQREQASDTATFFVERSGEEWRRAEAISPLYLVAVASAVELPLLPAESTLADSRLALLAQPRIESAELIGSLHKNIEEIHSALEHQLAEAELARAAETALQRQLGDREVEVDFQRRGAREDRDAVATLQRELAAAHAVTARVQGSVTWKAVQRLRAIVLRALGGEQSVAMRALRFGIRGASRVARRTRAPQPQPAPNPIELPSYEEPEVSIVIPLFAHAGLTRACLESIRQNTAGVPYEVILIDDQADPETKALLETVRNARILVNAENQGYLRSVNRATAAARGRWIVLCNNDIEVQDGWLRELVACGESSPDVGIVTPKYLYPDLTLNEAGGIIWRDGTGLNYGRGDSPGSYHYEYRREVDYGSAAALMVRADLWRDVGGFDERFLPMYYEDADLCFAARERGLRVMYEPRANVIHVEGGTAGTDLTSGYKRFQELNRPKFVSKWRERLERDQSPPILRRARRAADRRNGPHVLIVDHRVPMWDRDAGSARIREMIDSLIALGCRVTFLPDTLQYATPYSIELQQMGVEILFGAIDVEAELKDLGPGLALIITCRPHTSGRWLDLLRDVAPSVPIVYDTVDLHWLREARRAGAQAGRENEPVISPRARALREIELAMIRATDVTLAVSEEERAQILADVPDALVHIVPTVNPLRTTVPPPAERSGVVYVGAFEHTPNIDAAVRLVRHVMPRVWHELGDVRVMIVGGSAPDVVTALESPRVEVMGWVQDIDLVLDSARALVAPLTWGAGLKGKITQALAVGLPVVTTCIGSEGLHASDGDQLLIADDDDALAERVIRILRDDSLWRQLSENGQRLAAERFSPELMTVRMRELLNGVQAPTAV